MSKPNVYRSWALGIGLIGCLAGVTACGPAVQTTNASSGLKMGTAVSSSVWSQIIQGAQAGEGLSAYKEQITSHLVQGSLQSTFSVYGSINPPDRTYLAIHEGNMNVDYYQQGQVAYYYDNGRWAQSTPVSNLDVFASYEAIARQASAQSIALYQTKRQFIMDEYCDVYQSVIPAGMATTLPIWSVSSTDVGPMLMTWYVGQKDKVLREVDVQSVGSVPDVGSMEVKARTLLFDLNSKLAQVTLPKDLVKQLENSQ